MQSRRHSSAPGIRSLAGITVLAVAALPAQQETRLMIGDPAPALAVQEWVKGDAVEQLQGGVHVVEFWATWCGPCIAGMPHLSELQERYADRGVRILGINIWDEPANVAPFLANNVKMHGRTGAEIMRYTVGIEQKDDATDQRNGVMSRTWMAAAGRNGIPTAFVVDRKGTIAWIGHPSSLDSPLAEIVDGTYDLAAARTAYEQRVAAQARIDRYRQLFGSGDFAAAYELGYELVAGPLNGSASDLNDLAWRIVDPAAVPAEQDLALALLAALRGVALAPEDPAILDTLATVYHARGNLDKALRWQRKAAAHAEGTPYEAEIGARLAQYEKAAAAVEASAGKGDAGPIPAAEIKGKGGGR